MALDSTSTRRVLSIQSSVVSGYVGNKSAVFPLQLLGWDVDPLNTVQFSNHTGYGTWGGDRMSAQHLQSCFDALDTNGLLRYSHLLTGYAPGSEAVQVIMDIVCRLRALNPKLVYVLDPVMGDDGKMYVSEEVPTLYKQLLKHATIATPNDFEASILTSIQINSLDTLRQALSVFHRDFDLPHVIISSISMPLDSLPLHMRIDTPTGVVAICAGSSVDGKPWAIAFPRLEEHFEGVGDLFAALVLARFNEDVTAPCDALKRTAELAIATLQCILARTRQAAFEEHGPDANLIPTADESPQARIERLRCVEMRLIASKREIEEPIVVWRACDL